MKSEHHTGRLIASLVACLIPGYVALYLFTTSIAGWYSGLKKPAFIPPDIIVFYAIILVFSLLGLTLYTMWNADLSNREARAALRLFTLLVCLYFLWFVAFFLLQAAFFALIIIVMVVAVMLSTLVQVLWSTVVSALFLVPSLILVLIFCWANLQIVLMNPGLPVWGSVI
jgi:tryptophan-rich sensory protein